MNRFKVVFSSLSILCFLVAPAFGQGFTFDKEQYKERAVVEGKRGTLPAYYSLKNYTPIIYPQESGNCVAQSFSNALNILFAKKLNVYNKEEITLLRPSPFFIYYTNKLSNDYNCEKGLDAELVALNLLNKGIIPMMQVEYPNYYPFTSTKLCNYYPPSYQNDLSAAGEIRPDNIYRIETLMDIKTALAQGMPVVVGMMVSNSFQNCRSYVWSPSYPDNMENSYGHAVTIIGYSDSQYGGSFEIMNSWGENWGVNGYTRIRYTDAANWIIAGWAVEFGAPSSSYRYQSELEAKNDSLQADEGMVNIFNQALGDTLAVNPFFQRDDLEEVYRNIK